MTADYLQQYINQDNNSDYTDHENYLMFVDAAHEDSTDTYHDELAKAQAAYEEQLAKIEAKRQTEVSGLNTLMRFRNTATRIGLMIEQSLVHGVSVDVQKSITDELERLAHNCDIDLDDDQTYKLLFAPKLMPQLDREITDKASYGALIDEIENNNREYAKKQLFTQVQDIYRGLQEAPYGPKYAAHINAGFLEIQDLLEQGKKELALTTQEIYMGAFPSYQLCDRGSLAERWQRALRKISANELFQDMAKFQLDNPPNITNEYIEKIKRIDFSPARFSHAKLPDRSEQVLALKDEFVSALEDRKNFRRPAKDIVQIAVELQNPTYVINGHF